MNMLVRELKDYKAAAEVVSGAEDVFAMCGRDIAGKIDQVEKDKSVASGVELQQALDEARQEIADHENWQTDVLKSLPKQDDEDGLTGPLRQAFAKTAKARQRLAVQVNEANAKYFSKQ